MIVYVCTWNLDAVRLIEVMYGATGVLAVLCQPRQGTVVSCVIRNCKRAVIAVADRSRLQPLALYQTTRTSPAAPFHPFKSSRPDDTNDLAGPRMAGREAL